MIELICIAILGFLSFMSFFVSYVAYRDSLRPVDPRASDSQRYFYPQAIEERERPAAMGGCSTILLIFGIAFALGVILIIVF